MASSERRAGVLGSPVTHSLSPVLHNAAYQALGLTGWSFERIECDAETLPGLVGASDPDWVGYAVTMPGKRAALAMADVVTERAAAVGAANTLLRRESGWQADCTDVSGVTGALLAAGGYQPESDATGVILGAGGTASAALAGLADLDVLDVRMVVREPARATEARDTADRLGIRLEICRWSDTDIGALAASCNVLISTVPAEAAAPHAAELALAPCLLDVIYHPWPTPVADAVAAHGGQLATGLDMLLHQAFGQVEQFTGQPAPREAMRDALRKSTGDTLPLPLN